MTDADDVRLLSRAAAQLRALARPDVAAVVAALPRRPGATAPMADVAARVGVDLRDVGRAVARGRDAGVLALDGDDVGLDVAGVVATSDALVARTPLGPALAADATLAEHVPYGRVGALLPTDPAAADAVLAAVADLLPDGDLTEHHVTQALATVADDPVGLRRELVDAGLVERTPDGATYRRIPAATAD